uniref:F-box domain-containing protein n=1 Tax=Panagrellus redivivus TaxID=6233 RepID=A0A7E4VIU6_PANRE
MPFIKYGNHILPLPNLPYAFKRRLIQLSPLSDATKISIAWSDLGTLRNLRRECFHKIFITDNETACRLAENKLSNFKHFFDFHCMRHFSDGPFTINTTWESVLHVDEIVSKNKPFVVDDILVLYLTSVESYDRMVPLMVGSYTRLVLYGQFTWAQIKHLIHDKVEKVRIMGNVQVTLREHDDVVKLMLRFGRGSQYK